jgi:hypothetical protein
MSTINIGECEIQLAWEKKEICMGKVGSFWENNGEHSARD